MNPEKLSDSENRLYGENYGTFSDRSMGDKQPKFGSGAFLPNPLKMGGGDDESNLNYAINLVFHELLLVSRIVHSILKRGNHVKVEALIMPLHPLTSLSISPYPI